MTAAEAVEEASAGSVGEFERSFDSALQTRRYVTSVVDASLLERLFDCPGRERLPSSSARRGRPASSSALRALFGLPPRRRCDAEPPVRRRADEAGDEHALVACMNVKPRIRNREEREKSSSFQVDPDQDEQKSESHVQKQLSVPVTCRPLSLHIALSSACLKPISSDSLRSPPPPPSMLSGLLRKDPSLPSTSPPSTRGGGPRWRADGAGAGCEKLPPEEKPQKAASLASEGPTKRGGAAAAAGVPLVVVLAGATKD